MNDEIEIIHHDDGAIVLGSETAIEKLRKSLPGMAEKLKPWAINAAGKAIQIATEAKGAVPAEAGVWLKVSQESLDKLPKGAVKDLAEGVFRQKGGQIHTILRFDGSKVIQKVPAAKAINPAVAAPGPAILAAAAVQIAIDQAVGEVTAYLKVMDAKLDTLLRNDKVDKDGKLKSLIRTLDEAEELYETTGVVGTVTWDQIAPAKRMAFELQEVALGRLQVFANDIETSKTNTKKLRDKLEYAERESQYWFQILAVALGTYDRATILELAHRSEVSVETLDTVRRTLKKRREERMAEVTETVNYMLRTVEESAGLPAVRRVRAALHSPKVIEAANKVLDTVETFGEYTGIDLVKVDDVKDVGFVESVKELGAEVRTSFDGQLERISEDFKSLRVTMKKPQELRNARKIHKEAVKGTDEEEQEQDGGVAHHH
ncbi:hypothetical protein [Corynebacterium cystitidis]|uniref:hypothetical protein n=1 Tax=Corynebacterium cystitidis TaxID=35757 RepID=UPI00211ED3A5|nr:hypothetical protein [Corynebacterium cystitidis]